MKTQTNTIVFWTYLVHEEWNFLIAATSKGLCYVGSPGKPIAELNEWVSRHLPGGVLKRNDEGLQPFAAELIEYLQGKRQHFSLPCDLVGTPFQLAVWNELCEIPYGHTVTYSDIANRMKKPQAARAVGAAIGANPLLITVPCHRVIGKNGALTGYRGGLEMKTKLLQQERERAAVKGDTRYA